MLFPRVRRALRQPVRNEPLYVMRWVPTAVVMLVVIVGGGLAALWFADTWAAARTRGMDALDPETAALRLDAVKTALTVAAGLGAGVTLLLALRRQSITERAQRFAEQDAREERITTRYVAAVEQLGSDKAAVRLGGLYALERLGDDHPRLRQTVVDVVCAYLRMPFTSPSSDAIDGRQELEVRLTAQRLLAAHLIAPDGVEPTSYWWGADGQRMNLNLRNATLNRFDLSNGAVGDLDLTDAVFHGNAVLDRLAVHGTATFWNAAFRAGVGLRDAHFHATAWFDRVSVGWPAVFSGARFDGIARFTGAQFNGDCDLRDTTFHSSASLAGSTFGRGALLDRVVVHGSLNLVHAAVEVASLQDGRLLDGLDIAHARFAELNLAGTEIHGTVTMVRVRVKTLAPAEGWELTGDRDGDGYRRLAQTSGSPADEQGVPETEVRR